MSEVDEYGVPLDACDGKGWYPQYRRSQRWARAEYPDGYDVELPGRHAWNALTEKERVDALGSLFRAYWNLLHDKDNERRLDTKADNGGSYLKPGDVATLWEYMEDAPNEQGEIRVDRASLVNVLCEVELLQHRLTRYERADASNKPKTSDSEESR